ncbi:MAG TPA: pseudaminic acid synthase [Acidimicrobiales bacterium]|nr:pseudaminic acid synthase [Acidimicrobiales bacterium]
MSEDHADAPLTIAGRAIGPGHPVYVVAELSANHGGRLERALELVDASAAAGADAVKIQTYRADLMTIDADSECFTVSGGTAWDGRTLYDLYDEAATPWEWTGALQERAGEQGIHLFSTPFGAPAVDFLEQYSLPAYKIASFELVDTAFIERVAATGRPLIMSTGMATVEEIDEAVAVARAAGADQLALLRCNSAYPAPPEEMDLVTMVDMAERWGLPVGLSDHTSGWTVAVAAVALGASIVEKHVTRSRRDPTPDAAFSLEPDELAELVCQVRQAEAALGHVRYGPSEHEQASMAFRRSLFAVRDIRAGAEISRDDVAVIRPGWGLGPKHLDEVLARRAGVDIARGTPISWELLT